jgi:hypothetical protein
MIAIEVRQFLFFPSVFQNELVTVSKERKLICHGGFSRHTRAGVAFVALFTAGPVAAQAV